MKTVLLTAMIFFGLTSLVVAQKKDTIMGDMVSYVHLAKSPGVFVGVALRGHPALIFALHLINACLRKKPANRLNTDVVM
jgi:hypothetical protein